MHRLYLSRRNLETLLNRLNSGSCQSAILKNDTSHPRYPTSVPTLLVALEDSIYYTGGAEPPAMEAPPAPPVQEPAVKTKPRTGPIKVSARRAK